MIIDFSWLRRSLGRPHRFPDPVEDSYRAGWVWGVFCGATAGALITFVAACWLSHL